MRVKLLKVFSIIYVLTYLTIFGVVRIGVLLPLTGPLAAAGELVKRGVEIALSEKNMVLGEKIEIVYMDTRSERTESASGMLRLIDKEKVVAVIGEIMSGNSMVAGQIAESKKLPLVCPASTNPLVTQGKRFVSRVCFIDPVQGTALAEFATKVLKLKKVTVFTDIEQDYSVGLSNYFIERFKRYGGNVLQVQYKTSDQEFSAQISQAIAFGSQAILVAGYYNEIALVAQQARGLGFNGYFLAGDGANAPELVKIGGEAVEGMYFSDHYHPDGTGSNTAKRFLELYQKKYDEKPSTLSALGYDAYMIILKAIESVGSKDPEKIALGIRNVKNFEGVTGVITIDESGNAKKDIVILEVRNKQMNFFTKISAKALEL